MAATTVHRMTVEEFALLPEEKGPFYYELHGGELSPVPRPKAKHARIQKQLEKLLEHASQGQAMAIMELAFRPVPEYELRVANIGYLSVERWNAIDPNDYLRGAPDLVIEVLSPSNAVAEIEERRKNSIANGAQEFWVVDPERREVNVTTLSGLRTVWRTGDTIPLHLFGNTEILVDEIFR